MMDDTLVNHIYSEAGKAVVSCLIRFMGVANDLFLYPVAPEDQINLTASFEKLSLNGSVDWERSSKSIRSLRDFTILPIILLSGGMAVEKRRNPNVEKISQDKEYAQEALRWCQGYWVEFDEELRGPELNRLAIKSLDKLAKLSVNLILSYWDAINTVASILLKDGEITENHIVEVVNQTQPKSTLKVEEIELESAIQYQIPKILIEGRAYYSEGAYYRAVITEREDLSTRKASSDYYQVFYELPENSKNWTKGGSYSSISDAVMGVDNATMGNIEWEKSVEFERIQTPAKTYPVIKVNDNLANWEEVLGSSISQITPQYFSESSRFKLLGNVLQVQLVDYMTVYEEGEWWALTILEIHREDQKPCKVFFPLFANVPGRAKQNLERHEKVAFEFVTVSDLYGKRKWKILDAFNDFWFCRKLLNLFLPLSNIPEDHPNAHVKLSESGIGNFRFVLRGSLHKSSIMDKIHDMGETIAYVNRNGDTVVEYESGIQLLIPVSLNRASETAVKEPEKTIGEIRYSNREVDELLVGILLIEKNTSFDSKFPYH